MSFSHYYKTELSFIHEMARAFAEANPATAALLKERSSDPDVERLIEAFAFQAAGIRARMDAVAPSIVHGLAELLLPHYLRPLPASTIVEFAPNMRALRNRHKIARGRVLQSRPVEGTNCKFRTCWDVDLAPLEVVDATLDDAIAGRPAIRVTMRLSETGKGALAECDRVRFFLHHREPSLPAVLMLWLTRYCTAITARSGDGEPMQLAPKAIEPIGLQRDSAVFPWPDSAPTGYRALLEYFTLPEKYYFFDLVGLERCRPQTSEVQLRFEFERPPPLPTAIGKDAFRLHCTPAINLFDVAAEPVQYSPLEREHLLRADGVDSRHMEVYEVRSVTGVGRVTNARRAFLPFYRFTHTGSAARSAPYYALRRVDAIDDGIDTYIALDEPAGAPPPTQEEAVSIELVCTNRGLPRELQPGQITESTPGAMFKSYENITQVTSPVRVPLGAEALWRMLSHLALGQRGLVDVEALRALLGLYNLQSLGNVQIGRSNERQIEAVRRLQRETVTRLVYGIPVRAVRTRVELDETGFPSIGNAYVFGAVLNALFGSLANLNAASEVMITLASSKVEYAWPVQIGL